MLVLVWAMAMLSCVQPQLRSGLTEAQFQEIKQVIRAETKARITAVTLQKDGSVLVETAGTSSYWLRRVNGRWNIVTESISTQESD